MRSGATWTWISRSDPSGLRVGGVGGCYGPSDYLRRSDRLQGYAKRHYTADEIERLAVASSVDIVLTHDAPAGVRFEGHRRRAGYISEAAGLDAPGNLVAIEMEPGKRDWSLLGEYTRAAGD
jgi:hypothetical protein